MGKATGKNDIALTTIGYSNTDKDVAKAQEKNKKVMDAVMADLKNFGIDDADLQTNYSIYSDYSYAKEQQEFLGYKVNSSVTVKIRDLTKISSILSLAGKYGANEVGGLSFTIDDPENLKAQARAKALADAKIKAQKLAEALGARLVEVLTYNEYESGDYPIYKTAYGGMGGGGPAPEAISGGSKDVVLNVSITYKVVRQ